MAEQDFSQFVMDIFSLQFPLAIVAPDGWVELWRKPDSHRGWSLGGIKKYRKLGFVVADGAGQVWRLTELAPSQPISVWAHLKAVFSLAQFPVQIEVTQAEGAPLEIFKSAFLAALKKDDDILTHFRSAKEIEAQVASASSLSDLLVRLRRMRVLME